MREQVSQLCRDFKGWVEKNVQQGIDGDGREARYVSYSKLKEYWTHQRVATVLGHHEQDVDIAKIRMRYIQVISILTYITDDSRRWTEYLEGFCQEEIEDHSLPLPTFDPKFDREARFQQAPPPFHNDPAGIQAWIDFSSYQWTFLPLDLAPDKGVINRAHSPRTLDIRHIIPITEERELSRRSGRGARVVKVRPHEASGLSPEESIVLKEYDGKRNETEFTNERRTYTAIRNMMSTDANLVSKNFLRYYGCFVQGDRCVILIEYANQGSLLDFFRDKEYLPRSEKEARNLWNDLSNLIHGLALLHNGSQNNSSIHQDIKPANIFVSKIDSKETRFSFKFGDFGMSSVTPIAENGNTTGHDNGGTRMYSAPELCKIDPETHTDGKVSWAADIWSFGCVLLDCGVWMTLHERGRIEFRTQRIEETSSSQSDYLRNAGYSGAFHNGVEVLSIVQRKIKDIEALGSPAAQLTYRMMEFIHSEMLQSPSEQRLNAQQLGVRFRNAIDPPTRSSIDMPLTSSRFSQYSIPSHRTSNGISVVGVGDKGNEEILRPKSLQRYVTWDSDPNVSSGAISSPVSFDPEPSIRSPTLPPSEVSHPLTPSSNQSTVRELRRPSLSHHPSMATGVIQPGRNFNGDGCSLNTIQSVLDWIPKHKQNRAPMLGWLEPPLRRLRGRDQCFVFDNSWSMAPHWPDVKRTANALTYILKNADPDGFELHMTNSGNSPITRKNRKGLFETGGYFDQEAPRSDIGDCHMEQVLSTILRVVVGKALAPTLKLPRLGSRLIQGVSVYVFTNGVWEGRRNGDEISKEAGGVENAIKTVVDRLQADKQMRTFLSIQFIRFGDDPNGSERLSWLDDGIEEMTGGWDIVDTTKHTGDVKKMIIGAISRATDGG